MSVVQSSADNLRLSSDELQAMRLRHNPFISRGTGLLPGGGRHRGRRHGSGEELDSIGPWQVGDDRRHIDWHATARSGQLQVRRLLIQTRRPMLLLIDLRPHMFFGVHDTVLARTASLAAAAIAWHLERQGQPIRLHAVGLQAMASVPNPAPDFDAPALRARTGKRARLADLAMLADLYAIGLESSFQTDPLTPTLTLDRAIAKHMTSWTTGGDITMISDFSHLGDTIADSIAVRPSGSVHAIVVEDSAIRSGMAPGWYPVLASGTAQFEAYSIAQMGRTEQARAISDWQDRLRKQLSAVGVSSMMHCDFLDLASGQLR